MATNTNILPIRWETKRNHPPSLPSRLDLKSATQKMRNEPNLSLRPTPIMRNEPNLHPDGPVEDTKKRNEPNSSMPSVPPPPVSAKRTQSQPRRTCGGPKNAKRTQSPPGQSPKAKTCFSRNEPNSRPKETAKEGRERLVLWANMLFYRISGAVTAPWASAICSLTQLSHLRG